VRSVFPGRRRVKQKIKSDVTSHHAWVCVWGGGGEGVKGWWRGWPCSLVRGGRAEDSIHQGSAAGTVRAIRMD